MFTTLSSKNQITLPKSILTSLGVIPGQKFLALPESYRIVLTPFYNSVTNTLAGSLASKVKPRSRQQPFTHFSKRLKKKIVQKNA